MTDKETYSYKGWLVSDSFAKRMWAVFGYSLLGSFVFYLILLALILVLSIFIN